MQKWFECWLTTWKRECKSNCLLILCSLEAIHSLFSPAGAGAVVVVCTFIAILLEWFLTIQTIVFSNYDWYLCAGLPMSYYIKLCEFGGAHIQMIYTNRNHRFDFLQVNLWAIPIMWHFKYAFFPHCIPHINFVSMIHSSTIAYELARDDDVTMNHTAFSWKHFKCLSIRISAHSIHI